MPGGRERGLQVPGSGRGVGWVPQQQWTHLDGIAPQARLATCCRWMAVCKEARPGQGRYCFGTALSMF